MWKNMKTAPKDGSVILIADDEKHEVLRCFWGNLFDRKTLPSDCWVDFDSWNGDWGEYDESAKTPLCWRDLPEFPTQEELDNIEKEN